MQQANSFDPVTVQKILKGAMIAGAGAILTYIAQAIAGMDFGAYTPVVVMIASVLVNGLREYLAGQE